MICQRCRQREATDVLMATGGMGRGKLRFEVCDECSAAWDAFRAVVYSTPTNLRDLHARQELVARIMELKRSEPLIRWTVTFG